MTSLHQEISNRFNLADIRTLSFDLSIRYDELRGETLTEKILALLDYCQQHNRLSQLQAALQAQRPNVDWPPYFATLPDYAQLAPKPPSSHTTINIQGDAYGTVLGNRGEINQSFNFGDKDNEN